MTATDFCTNGHLFKNDALYAPHLFKLVLCVLSDLDCSPAGTIE